MAELPVSKIPSPIFAQDFSDTSIHGRQESAQVVENKDSLNSVIENMPGLKSLDLKFHQDADFTAMFQEHDSFNFPHLTELKLSGCTKLEDSHVRLLGLHFSSVTYLDVSRCSKLTDRSMTLLSSYFLHLTHLDLSECIKITDKGICELSEGQFPLKHLRMNRLSRLTDDSLEYLSAVVQNLEHLELEGCNFTDIGMEHLGVLYDVMLESLKLFAGHASGDSLRNLIEMKSLTELHISGCQTIDGGLRHLATMTWLRKLSLRDCVFGTAGMSHLTHKNCWIDDFRIENCEPITDHDFQYLSSMCNLQFLWLNRCSDISFDGFQLFTLKSYSMHSLSFSELVVIDIYFKYLAEMDNLRNVTLSYCSGITNKGLLYLNSRNCGIMELTLTSCEGVTSKSVCRMIKYKKVSCAEGLRLVRR